MPAPVLLTNNNSHTSSIMIKNHNISSMHQGSYRDAGREIFLSLNLTVSLLPPFVPHSKDLGVSESINKELKTLQKLQHQTLTQAKPLLPPIKYPAVGMEVRNQLDDGDADGDAQVTRVSLTHKSTGFLGALFGRSKKKDEDNDGECRKEW